MFATASVHRVHGSTRCTLDSIRTAIIVSIGISINTRNLLQLGNWKMLTVSISVSIALRVSQISTEELPLSSLSSL